MEIKNCEFSTPVNISSTSTPQYAFSEMTCETSYEFSTSTPPVIINSFTFGEIIIGFFAFLIFSTYFLETFWFKVVSPQIHRIHLK